MTTDTKAIRELVSTLYAELRRQAQEIDGPDYLWVCDMHSLTGDLVQIDGYVDLDALARAALEGEP